MFCFQICTPEGRSGEKGGSANFKTKNTESLTQDVTSSLYIAHDMVEKKKYPKSFPSFLATAIVFFLSFMKTEGFLIIFAWAIVIAPLGD